MENLQAVKKLEEREISYQEFLEIMKDSYMKTTYGDSVIFQNSLHSLEKVFQARIKAVGKMTVGFAKLCANSYTTLDQGL